MSRPMAPRTLHRQRIATARGGMISTAHRDATDAGVEMLSMGGNAFDAAVAASLALGVCEPQASGLGGQSMVLLHDAQAKETVALDGSSRAPERATPEAVPLDAREFGHRATTVPSTPAVLGDVLQRHGSLRLEDVMQPALRLAEDGYEVSRLQHHIQREKMHGLAGSSAARFFLRNGKRPYQPGEVHVQQTLAETLRRLTHHGMQDFYHGQVARSIVNDMRRNRGLITMRDLAQVPWPVARKPDLGKWRGRKVATFPPPGAGRVLLEILHVLDRSPKRLLDPETPQGAVFMARAIKQALHDHGHEPRDPARHQMTPHQMIAADHARLVAIRLRRGLHGDTTHLSVMDKEGNAVGVTQSIELFYGACAAAPDLGFLYNNYLSACHDDPRHPYSLRPNGVPWSSVAPAIVFKRGRPQMILGSPGSDRIAPAVAQVMLHLRSMEPLDAVEAPRLHAHPDGTAWLEAPRFRTDVTHALEQDGFRVVPQEAYSLFHGCVQLVARQRGGFVGVADSRRDGTAGGPDTRHKRPASSQADMRQEDRLALARKQAAEDPEPTGQRGGRRRRWGGR